MNARAPDGLRRWSEAWLFAAAVLVVETLAVAAASRREIAAGYEVSLALKTLLPLAMLLAVPLAVLGAALSLAVERAGRREGRAMGAMLAAAWCGAVALACSSGRQLAGSRRPAFVLVALMLGALAGWVATGAATRSLAALRGRSRVAALGAIALGLGALELTNLLVLPRLYPGFHLGLGALTLMVAGLGANALGDEPTRVFATPRRGLLATLVVLLAAAGLAAVAPQSVCLHDNLRWIYLERAPLVGRAVEVAAALAPPPPLDEAPLEVRDGPDDHSLELGSRDVLLVTIDALRADHVGAYGYDRKTTPRLDALARDGAVFEAAYTATPHTSYAIASLMTGKYMRPLLLQGLGADSETLAEALRRYDFRTAAFYPPAVFFVDRERFTSFEERGLGFEYRKEQFAAASDRASELAAYLKTRATTDRLFVWVHLFEPHEPYVAHPEHDFGDRALDRYDSEIAAADAGLGAIVDAMRSARPNTLVVVTADHGEEFGDHGGRYHGTSVYDEQVRVPLVVNAPGLVAAARVRAPTGLTDIMPTILGAARIPISPRVRGRSLGAALSGQGEGPASAFSETDEQTLYARGTLRLVCARKIGACRLHDIASDPRELEDLAGARPTELASLKAEQRRLVASLGRYEAGADEGWPHALRRGLAGDTDAAEDVATLLGDADVRIRRKAAETLFELAAPPVDARAAPAAPTTARVAFGDDVAEPLRRALASDEDAVVRRYAALALTRLGQGAPLAVDLARGVDADGTPAGAGAEQLTWKRLAALALAEGGDARGEGTLIGWWSAAFPEGEAPGEALSFERKRQLAAALGALRSEDAVTPLTRGLADVRLRRFVARALEAIGKDVARPALARALRDEPYHDARSILAGALVSLGGRGELVAPLVRFLGVPDPMPDGLTLAERADVLSWIGGPSTDDLARLVRFATSGVAVAVRVPGEGEVDGQGARVVVRARARDGRSGEVRVSVRSRTVEDRTRPVPKAAPTFDPERGVTIAISGESPSEVHGTLPPGAAIRAGDALDVVVYATQNVEVTSLALVPLQPELAPPTPASTDP
ncbi:MAG: sulfatase-like hydrolase/transferase [Deltaproteobacteria bacterium]|nr:sulfatase-like hydrolase/transferase [Deltaproteobacteria bacterium]